MTGLTNKSQKNSHKIPEGKSQKEEGLLVQKITWELIRGLEAYYIFRKDILIHMSAPYNIPSGIHKIINPTVVLFAAGMKLKTPRIDFFSISQNDPTQNHMILAISVR